MKISYKWLQSYFEKKLPEPDKLAERITFSFAEIEGVEKKGDPVKSAGADHGASDTILDIKVLPDRACYALSHRGVAGELSAILNLPLKKESWPVIKVGKVRNVDFEITNDKLCRRHIGRVVEGITVGKSPAWLKDRLEAVGQRSINNIVDATNFVTLDMGQPLHAFDAYKLKGKVTVRPARAGEVVVTLDGKTIPVDPSIIVIADEDGPLDIAGIKGGKKAELDQNTKAILLSAANFDHVSIRRGSAKTGVKTDASKRFENNLTPERVKEGMDEITALIAKLCPKAIVGKEIDLYPKKAKQKEVRFSSDDIRRMVGVSVSDADMSDCLERLGIQVKKHGKEFVARIPYDRSDLSIPADIAEEVGRIIGYDKIPSVMPPIGKGNVEIPKSFYYEWKIRETLINAGFSEVMTSSFGSIGDVAIEKPLAEDKKYARENLRNNFEKALKMNLLNAPLFGTDETRIFEIGRIFTKEGERTALALGVAGPKKKIAGVLDSAVKNISEMLGSVVVGETKDGVFECVLDTVFEKLPEPKKWDISILPAQNEKFTPFSLYPFIVRDVALFVSRETEAEDVRKVIWENTSHRFDKDAPVAEVMRLDLFDEFEKAGKKSFAFRLVFQVFDRTLTDEQANDIMEKLYGALKMKGWEVR